MLGPISTVSQDAHMPDLMGENNIIKLLPSAHYDSFDPDGLKLWCHRNARYGLPTLDLIVFLHREIAGRRAIEIGAGAGDLCHHLGIPGTDNHMQEWPMIRAHYASVGQPPIRYGEHVEALGAAEAIAAHKPEVVIASWVTQWIDPDDRNPSSGGNIFGVHEDEIVASGVTYILIGNASVHGDKKIMAQHHQALDLGFVRSRSSQPYLNRIWIWNRI